MKKFISILFMLMLGVSLPCLAQSTQEHVVTVGEDFESIADKYGITVQQLKDMNPKHRGVFYVGMKLNVPKVERPEPAAAPVVAAKKDKKAEAKAKKEEAKAKKEEAKAKKEASKKDKSSSKADKKSSKADKDAAKADKEAEKEAKKAAKEAEKAEKAAARKAKLEERKASKKKK